MIFMKFGARFVARTGAVRTVRLLALLLVLPLLTLSLTACGYKGDLTHPTAHTNTDTGPHLDAPIA